LARGEQRIVKAGREGYRVRVWRVVETPEGVKNGSLSPARTIPPGNG